MSPSMICLYVFLVLTYITAAFMFYLASTPIPDEYKVKALLLSVFWLPAVYVLVLKTLAENTLDMINWNRKMP